MNPRSSSARWWLGAAAIAVAAGCSGGDGGDEFADGFSVSGALAEVPARLSTSDGFLFLTGDVDGMSDAVGVDRTDGPATDGALNEWGSVVFTGVPQDEPSRRVELPMANVLLQVRGASDDAPPVADELGWDLFDVDRYVSAWSADGGSLDVVLIDADLAAGLGPIGDDGLIRLGDAPDGEFDVQNRTTLRTLGESLKLAVGEGGLVAVSAVTPPVADWAEDATQTWADEPDVAAAAAALDRVEGLYAAGIWVVGPEVLAASDGAGALGLADGETVVVGFGYAGAGPGQRTRQVFVFADEDAAAAALPGIANVASSGAVVGSGRWTHEIGDVTQDGRLLIVDGTSLGAG